MSPEHVIQIVLTLYIHNYLFIMGCKLTFCYKVRIQGDLIRPRVLIVGRLCIYFDVERVPTSPTQ